MKARLLSALLPQLVLISCIFAAPSVPPGDGQILEKLVHFADPHAPASDPARKFVGQTTPSGKLVLTASNGFFDTGIRATGTSAVMDAVPDSLIAVDFASLGNWTEPGTTMRWHLWIEQPGKLYLNTHLVTSEGEEGSRLKYDLGGIAQVLTTRAEKDPATPQGEPLEFDLTQPGWQTLTLTLEKLAGTQVGQIHRLEAYGPAASGAKLLRTRWRPAACHARFSSSKVPKPILWVMSTRIAPGVHVSSYSPVTTPFGYFGTSFNADGTSSPTANFSLWSFGQGKPTPQENWSHLLATGSPDATFGSFGHEGSGVKLRGDWKPFGDDSREVTLALRGEKVGSWIHWFGYYLDPSSQRFRLYAAAADWSGSRPMRSLVPGAFVEVPGPPDRQRSGDQLRDILRRGWMLDEQKQWHPIDTMSAGKGLASKHWRTADNWFSMGMGGMPYHEGPGDEITLDLTTQALPPWLQGQALDDLFRLPVTIGPRHFHRITRDSCELEVLLSDMNLAGGEKATLTVYHGPDDCLTFTQDLGYKEAKTRFWPKHRAPIPVAEGSNRIVLDGLAPGTTHRVRLLVETPRGKVWSFATDSFQTLP